MVELKHATQRYIRCAGSLGWPFPASLRVKCALQRLFNAAYGGTQRGRAHEMWMFKETNFAKVAEGMACFGIRVEKPDELRSALQRAFSFGRLAVIDAVSDYKALHPRAWA